MPGRGWKTTDEEVQDKDPTSKFIVVGGVSEADALVRDSRQLAKR
jgi:hypothetical protein